MNRKTWLLGGLALLLGLSLAYAWWATPRQERVPVKPAVRSRALPTTPAGSDKAPSSEPRVLLDILERGGAPFNEPSRDIFRVTANGSPSSLSEPEGEPVTESEIPTVDFAPPAEFPPAADAAANLTASFAYLGSLEKDGVKKVFLGVNGEIFIARAGESFGPAGEYRVEEIARDKLVVLQGGRPVTLSLTDTSQQTASLSGRTNRPAPEREAPVGPGRARLPVFPEPPEDGGDVEAVDVDMTAEPPPEEEPPPSPPEAQPANESVDPTMGSMSTLQLRSTIQ